MSSKYDPEALCAGMRVGTEFLSQLLKALEKTGASAHMIRFMTLPQNAEKFEEWVKFGVSQIYPVPRSLIEKLVEEDFRDDRHIDPAEDPEHYEQLFRSDRIYWWDRIDLEKGFGIPTLDLGWPFPTTVHEQIVGVPLADPHTIEYRGERYVVVHIYYEDCLTPMGGRPFPGLVYKDAPTSITLAPLKYFDLDN